MELRNLYTFLRTAELGSFTRAAQELGYVQSTITAQIQQLEQEIGAPLFEHIGRKNLLTPYGQQLIGYANEMLQTAEKIKALGRETPEDLHGTLRIGILESILSSLMLDVLERYRSQCPHVSIYFHAGVSATLFDLLRRSEVDMIFTLGELTDAENCIRAYSHPERAVFVASPNHPLSGHDRVTLQEIWRHPIILTGENTYLQHELTKLSANSGHQITSYIQTGSSYVILEMVRRGLGISLLPEYQVRAAVEAGELCILPPFSLPFYTHIFYHKNKWLTPQMAEMIHLTADCLGREYIQPQMISRKRFG